MKQLILFFSLFFFQISLSQIDSVSYYYNKGELNKSIKYGEGLIEYLNPNYALEKNYYF